MSRIDLQPCILEDKNPNAPNYFSNYGYYTQTTLLPDCNCFVLC